MTHRRSATLASLILALLVLVTGCGGDAGTSNVGGAGATAAPAATTKPATSMMNYPPPIPAGTTVNISFANYNLASAGIGKDATEQLIAEFMAANPSIKVEGRGINSAEITAKVQADVVAGNPPDVMQGIFGDLDFIVNDLRAQAIEDLVPPDELAAWKGGPYPLSVNGLKLGILNGKTYGAPYTFSTPTLFYNADLFTAAGLDPNKPPTTWAEVKQYALAIKAKTGKDGVTVTCIDSDWCYQGLVRSNGGRVLSEDRKSVTFASPEGVEVAKMLQDLVQSGAQPKLSSTESSTAFSGGNVGMILYTSALQSSYLAAAKGKWTLKTAKMPSFAGKPTVPTNSGSGLFILSKDPMKQRAAWELMKFITSERGYTIITSKIGYLPLRSGIVNDDKYLKPWVTENPLVQPNLEQLEKLEPWVSFPGSNYRQEVDIMMKAVQSVVFDGAPAESTLKAAQDRVTGLLPKR